MARKRNPKFKMCRRLGLNVCGHPKAMDRATKYNSREAKKLSSYGVQLLEKQRLRSYYEVLEKQFRKYVQRAMKSDEITGDALVKILESRLDNMVYRVGFANSIRQARQMVVHGHILVNGKKVDRPSFEIKVGDEISLKEKSRKNEMFKENFENLGFSLSYLEKNLNDFSAKFIKRPDRSEIPIEINDHLVVEFYSKLVK